MLTVDDTQFEVIDGIEWSTVPLFAGPRAPCFIQATVRVADSVRARLLNITGGTVRLQLAGGRTIEGHGLIRTGPMEVLCQCATVIYEGARVDEV